MRFATLKVDDDRWVLADSSQVKPVSFGELFYLKWWANRDYVIILDSRQGQALLVDYYNQRVLTGVGEGDILIGYVFLFRDKDEG